MEELTEKFIIGLRKKDNTFIYFNLFSILAQTNPNFLEYIVNDFKSGNEDWFVSFHKSLRQCDFFDSDKISIIKPLITKAERKEREEILAVRASFRRKYSLEELSHDLEYTHAGKRLGEISVKSVTYERVGEGISGHLDSILHETISRDNGELYNYMDKFLNSNINLENDK